MKKNQRAVAEPGASVAELQAELRAIRQLLTLLLAKLGADSKEIGMALGVSPSTVRNTFSFRQVGVINLTSKAEEE